MFNLYVIFTVFIIVIPMAIYVIALLLKMGILKDIYLNKSVNFITPIEEKKPPQK